MIAGVDVGAAAPAPPARPTPRARAVAGLWFAAFGAMLASPTIVLAFRFAHLRSRIGVPGGLAGGLWLPVAGMALAGSACGARTLIAGAGDSDAFRIGVFTGALAAAPALVRAAAGFPVAGLWSPSGILLILVYAVVWGVVPFAVVGGFAGWTLWLSRIRLGFDRRTP